MSRLDDALSRVDLQVTRALPAGQIPGLARPKERGRPRRFVPLIMLALLALALPLMAGLHGARRPLATRSMSANAAQESPPPAGEEPGRALVRRGVEAVRTGAYDEARCLFEEALELNPSDPDAWNNLGVVLVRQGDQAKGVEAFREALGREPTHADAHRNLAVALERRGESREAARHYRSFLALSRADHPDRAEVRRRLGE